MEGKGWKKTGSPVKDFVTRLNQAFETENILAGANNNQQKPPYLADGLPEPEATSDVFKASRKLLSSPEKHRKSVRDALEDAALKLSSVGDTLRDLSTSPSSSSRPSGLAAAGQDEWNLSTENPVFSEVNTPRGNGTMSTPRQQIASPSRSTPRSARGMPGSAQKVEANNFPRSFPVKKEEEKKKNGLAGLTGWMRRGAALENGAAKAAAATDASDDSPIIAQSKKTTSRTSTAATALFRDNNTNNNTTSSMRTVVLLLILGLVAAVLLTPAATLPLGGVGAVYRNTVQKTAIYSEISILAGKTLSTLGSMGHSTTAPARAAPRKLGSSKNLPALVIPPKSISASRFSNKDLKWRSMLTVLKEASPYTFRSNKNALQEVKTAQRVLQSVETPLKLVIAAGAGVCLAGAVVAGLLRLQGVAPLFSLANLKGIDGPYNADYDMIEEYENVPPSSSSKAKKTPSRRASAAAVTPRSSRRLVSAEANSPQKTSVRKAWKRQN